MAMTFNGRRARRNPLQEARARRWREYVVPDERGLDQEYINDTGQDITLFLQSQLSSGQDMIRVWVTDPEGNEVRLPSAWLRTGGSHALSGTFVVPNGSTYRVTNREIVRWCELRAEAR